MIKEVDVIIYIIQINAIWIFNNSFVYMVIYQYCPDYFLPYFDFRILCHNFPICSFKTMKYRGSVKY